MVRILIVPASYEKEGERERSVTFLEHRLKITQDTQFQQSLIFCLTNCK